jgi:hypothetical protein
MKKEKTFELTFADDILSRLSLNQRITFYLKTDPRFFFEYKKLNLESKIGQVSTRERHKIIEKFISEAEKRRLIFMINSLKDNTLTNISFEELTKEYSKVSQKYQTKLKTFDKKVKEKELLELTSNSDYQSMTDNFDKMKLKRK